jgi:hypothetical protein
VHAAAYQCTPRFSLPGPGVRGNAVHGTGRFLCSARPLACPMQNFVTGTCLHGVGELHVPCFELAANLSLSLSSCTFLASRSGPTDNMRICNSMCREPGHDCWRQTGAQITGPSSSVFLILPHIVGSKKFVGERENSVVTLEDRPVHLTI